MSSVHSYPRGQTVKRKVDIFLTKIRAQDRKGVLHSFMKGENVHEYCIFRTYPHDHSPYEYDCEFLIIFL